MTSILPCIWPSRSIFVKVYLYTHLLTSSLYQALTICNQTHSFFFLYIKDGMSTADGTSCFTLLPHHLAFIKVYQMRSLHEFGGRKKGEDRVFYSLLSAFSNRSSSFCITGLLMSYFLSTGLGLWAVLSPPSPLP